MGKKMHKKTARRLPSSNAFAIQTITRRRKVIP
jgi:hypothetical protein